MPPTGNQPRCGVCATKLVKNGTTSANRTRWRCKTCGASATQSRPDVTRSNQLRAFLSWAMGKHSQRELDGGSGRTFRARHTWCWNVAPTIAITGEIYDQIQLDGTYLTGGWCLLVAINSTNGHVIAWQWCNTETTAAWTALITRIPPPRVVVIDGGSGLASALKTHWPTTRIQRCLVHVQRNTRTYLTMRPRTKAGRTLRALGVALTQIRTVEQATAWETKLHDWYQTYKPLIDAKTYLARAGTRPASVRPGATWWWTHERLRKAYQLLARLVRQGVLFTYLDPEFADLSIASTTNRIEGGTNSPIKLLLRLHRGMTSAHQRRAVEWWCYLHSENPADPATLIRPKHWAPAKPARPVQEPDGPALYDTHVSAEEGLWVRTGWAGRSH